MPRPLPGIVPCIGPAGALLRVTAGLGLGKGKVSGGRGEVRVGLLLLGLFLWCGRIVRRGGGGPAGGKESAGR